MAAVRSTHGLEVPLSDDDGVDLVDEKYVKFVVQKANAKLKENFARIQKFEEKFRKIDEAGRPEQTREKRKKLEKTVKNKVDRSEEDLADVFDSMIFENGS